RVGRHDNFFELGGDSILSLKVVAQAHHAGIAITPRQLFDTQSVSTLAQVLVQTLNDGATQPGVPPITVIAAGERTALPLSHAQQRLWFLWNLQPGSSAYHMPGALRLSGELDADAVRASIDAVVARHESLRTTFAAQADGDVVQSIGTDTRCDWRVVDIASADAIETTLASTANAFAAEPFDLVHGPLLRVALIRLGEREHVLAVVMHHIVSDGWSVDVLLQEFVDGYRARREGTAAHLRELPVQYADYALWQRRWLEAGEQARQLAYWRAQLGEDHPVLALPSDRARQAVSAWHGATHRIGIPDTLARAIRQRAQQLRATPFVVLLAGFQLLLHRYTAQHDIRVGVPAANRERVETEGLIGLFVNTLVMRAQMDGSTPLTALLETVRRDAQAAQAHQDLPFDVLVDALQPQRSLSHAPLFQVMFNHLRDDERVLDTLPGVRVGWYGLS
ncbi:condensation domain-containing protein, partial [Paraburkholderia fungorum]|uniref:condensation domain-containing protein n=1 Tax=Paraburkholderia fungorum TaxID=134537 RepID=UPI0038B706EE